MILLSSKTSPFLTEANRDSKVTMYLGTVFNRDKDVNTPVDRCASDKQIEKIYLERLGVLDEHFRLIKTVLEESAYNKTPGLGDQNCLFLLEGHLLGVLSPIIFNKKYSSKTFIESYLLFL